MVSAALTLARRVGTVGFSLVILLTAPLARAACDDLLLPTRAPSTASRLVTADDILRLRDIGLPDAAYWAEPSALALAPDGRRLALLLNRADPARNSSCRALVLVSLDGRREVRALDRGGDPITMMGRFGGLLTSSGTPTTVTPAWSPDGQWIAYLRRDHGVTQLWRVRPDGGPGDEGRARPITQSPVDVESFAWSQDGRRLIYTATPALVEAEKVIDVEGRSGWLNDARMMTNYGARPMVSALLTREIIAVNPDSGEVSPATPSDRDRLAPSPDNGLSVRSSNGSQAWTRHVSGNPMSALRLLVEDPNGRPVACTARECTGRIDRLWWAPDGRSLIILRREGWNDGQIGLLRWVPGTASFRRILLTNDVLKGCLPRGEALVCTSENAVTPRHVVEVNLRNGVQRDVYDPNPDFRTLRLGSVTRLTWTNDIGLPAWGDLVLPPDYRPGTKLPMIVTQYHSVGFLRGGTGDEYPIHAFAARGFAVLSLERPPAYGSDNPDLKSDVDIAAAGVKDWNERRSLLSSLVNGVKMVLARGVVDPTRIGITGLSDGASTTRFALVNTRLFAAAAISTCCADTNAMMNAGGILFADIERSLGYPSSIARDEAFWAPYSMSLSATRMDRPLLMQLADREMNLSLETFMALREAGQPVEMYVYPDEYHNKWQPAHRQAIYERNLDWFSFWLQGRLDPDPTKAAQYARWTAMKVRRVEAVSPRGS